MGCLVPIGFILLAVLGCFLWKMRSYDELQALEQTIQDLGEPLTPEQVTATYGPATGEKDKTKLFLALIPLIENEGFSEDQRPYPFVGIGPEFSVDRTQPWMQQQEVQAFFEKHANLMNQIEEAALAEGDVHFHDYTKGIGASMVNIQAMRGMARLLELQARLQVRTGESDAAIRSVRALIGVGEAFRNQPALLSQLVRAASRGVLHDTICDLLPEADWSDEQIQQLIDELHQPDWRQSLKDALIGERALGRAAFEDPSQLGSDYKYVRYLSSYEDERFFLEMMTDRINATDRPFPEMFNELDRINARLNSLTQFQRLSRPVSTFVVPANSSSARTIAQVHAMDRAVAAQLAVELYRRKHGEYPKSLKVLVPEFLPEAPIDPFSPDKQLLIYRVEKTEVVIYTVHNNGIDDGGVEDDFANDFSSRVKRKQQTHE